MGCQHPGGEKPNEFIWYCFYRGKKNLAGETRFKNGRRGMVSTGWPISLSGRLFGSPPQATPKTQPPSFSLFCKRNFLGEGKGVFEKLSVMMCFWGVWVYVFLCENLFSQVNFIMATRKEKNASTIMAPKNCKLFPCFPAVGKPRF